MDVNNNATSWLPEYSWGPRRDPLYTVIPLTVIYAIIFLAGSVGNIITCFVIVKNKYMHTATNYYLLSLAISDLLLLITGLPMEVYYLWSRYPYIFGETFCIIQGFASETSTNATVLTITAFTIERYVAICHPFYSHIVSKLSRAVRYIIAIWIAAALCAIPQAAQMGIVYGKDHTGRNMDELRMCALKNPFIPYSFEISMVLFFITPMTVITVLYILIGLKLYRPSATVNNSKMKNDQLITLTGANTAGCSNNIVASTSEIQRHKLHNSDIHRVKHSSYKERHRSTKRVVNMLIVVVLAFLVCWAPFQMQRLLAIYGQSQEVTDLNLFILYQLVTHISGILYYFSAVINPIVYNIMSWKFRKAFKDTIRNCTDTTPERRNSEEIGSSGTHRNYCEAKHPNSFCSTSCPNEMELFSDFSKRPIVVNFRTCRSPSFKSFCDSNSFMELNNQIIINNSNINNNNNNNNYTEKSGNEKNDKTCTALIIYPNCRCSKTS